MPEDRQQSEAELPEQLKKQIELWRSDSRQSEKTLSDFNQHLSVLSAGSIAVIASGTVALLSYKATHPAISLHLPTTAVLLASISMWVTLASCIANMFLDTIIEHQSSSNTLSDLINRLYEWRISTKQLTSEDEFRARAVMAKSKTDVEGKARRHLNYRRAQRTISLIGVAAFLAGYGLLVYFIWTECQLL